MSQWVHDHVLGIVKVSSEHLDWEIIEIMKILINKTVKWFFTVKIGFFSNQVQSNRSIQRLIIWQRPILNRSNVEKTSKKWDYDKQLIHFVVHRIWIRMQGKICKSNCFENLQLNRIVKKAAPGQNSEKYIPWKI